MPSIPDGRRIALVIGNSTYRDAPLKNAARDAEAVARALERLGFSVTLRREVGHSQFPNLLADFGESAAGADIAMIFYAGHGLECDGETYLLPVDKPPTHVRRLRFEAQQLAGLLSAVGGAKGLGLVALDACRSTHFRSQIEGIEATRSAAQGLAPVQPTGNVLVAYAAKHGTVAMDGQNDHHSPFTAALLRFISTPRLDVRILFGKIRDAVLERTDGEQEPHLYGSLGGREIYLTGESGEQVLPNVFVSYAKRDRGRIEQLGRALQGHGWNVFWDEKLEVGTEWRKEIEQRLKTAHCVVAVWSRNAIRSDWVKYEATRGMEQGILVPVTIDGTPPPKVFDSVQTENLKEWDGRPEDPQIAKVRRGIEQVLARRAEPEEEPLPPPTATMPRMDFVRLAIIATCAALVPSLLVTAIVVSKRNEVVERVVQTPVYVEKIKEIREVRIEKLPPVDKEKVVTAEPRIQPPPPEPKIERAVPAPTPAERKPPVTETGSLQDGFFPLLGSYKSHELAERLATDLREQAQHLLQGKRVVVRDVDVQGKGLHHRVLIEPSSTHGEVLRICASLGNIGFKGCTPIPLPPSSMHGSLPPAKELGRQAGFFVLLGSYQSREYAKRRAADLRGQVGRLLDGRRVVVRKKDFPGKYAHYRVLVEPSTTREGVVEFCAALKSRGITGCSPVHL